MRISNRSIFRHTDGLCYSFSGNGGYVRNAGLTVYEMGITRAMRRHSGSSEQVDAPPHHTPLPPAFSHKYVLGAPPWHVCSLASGSAGVRQLREVLFLRAASLSLSKAATGRNKAGTG